jgi:UDP-N-acetylglucosamine transferase subunit ALG13
VIFVTVGAQMAFDRLVRTVDCWAGEHGRKDVFAQVGQTDLRPSNIEWTPFLSPEDHKRKYETAEVIVAHAGTGSILTALQFGKPILIMPRRASLHETRNDHQVATSERFRCFDSVAVALDEEELMLHLSKIDGLRGRQAIQPYASHELLATLARFVNDDKS